MERFAAVAFTAVVWSVALAEIQHGTLEVVELTPNNDPNAVNVTRVGGSGPWSVVRVSGADQTNRGDYVIELGAGQGAAAGVMIVGPAQGGRTEPSVNYSPYFATLATERSASGRYFISVFDAPPGNEVNFNPAFVYFPNADGWLAAAAYNSANNGAMTSLLGNPLVALRDETSVTGSGYEFVDSSATTGLYELRFEGLDLRRDGIILTSGAKNEDNRTVVSTRIDGTAILNCMDNGAESGGENDPAAFVFIPMGTPGVTMGAVTASARILQRQGEFSVEMVGQPGTDGTYRLTIPGESPSTGTLIVVPHSELTGASVDNCVYVIPEATAWKIETRDIAALPAGLTLQDLNPGDIAFHFAFFKSGAAITPGTPPRDWTLRLNDIVAARFTTTEFNAGNTLGDMRCERVAGSTALDVFGDNRGDIGISYLGARPEAYSDNALDAVRGVFLGAPTEFNRNNAPTSGVSGWTSFSFDNGEVHLHSVNNDGGEINSNFCVAFFPLSLGVPMAADFTAHAGQAVLQAPYPAATGGVLLATNWDNDNRVVAAMPLGNQYIVRTYDGVSGAISPDSAEIGFVQLPYTLPGLIAGQIDAFGNTISGVGGFSTSLGFDSLGFPVTRLMIDGVNANSDGVLILTATDGPYAMAWEPAANGAFEVAGFNLVTDVRGRTGFAFVYVPYDTTCPNCVGDIARNCTIDMDDALVVLGHLGQTSAPYEHGDLTRDGRVDLADVAILQDDFGRNCEVPDAPPTMPTLLAPDDNAAISDDAVDLAAEAADPDGDPIDVTFYGRRVVLNTAAPFTIVALPDTQFYSQTYPEIFNAQTQWILDNWEPLNIAYVMHLGDIVNQSAVIQQWVNADAAISILDINPAIPYGLTVGNHDQEPCCGGSPGGTTNFNTYFPYSRYLGLVPWYGGHYGTRNDNSFITFDAGEMNFIALHFEFDTAANPAVLAWADNVLASHPNHRAIAITHWMCNTGNPASFSSQGLQIYNTLKHHPKLFLLHGGHISGEGRRSDTFNGRTVHTLLADYQSRINGGNGWLRLMEFRPAENRIIVKTFSPWLMQYELDADSYFTLDYDMSLSEFVELGAASISSGATAHWNWTNLEPGTYEWYVVAQNEAGQARSATRKFTVEHE